MARPLVVLLLCLSSLLGCRSPEPRSPEAVRQKAAEPAEPSIFDQLPLAPRQRQSIDGLLKELRDDLAAYEEARIALLDEIVVGVRAGAFDRKKLEPLIERAIVTYEQAAPRVIDFANRVHRTLSPSQRQQLVKLWDKGDDELSEEERRAKEEDELTQVLDLTGSQKTRLFTPLLGTYLEYYGPIGDFRKSWKEVKAAFEKEGFDAGQQRFFTALPLRALARGAFEASESVLSVLEPAQRETLAVTIEAEWRD